MVNITEITAISILEDIVNKYLEVDHGYLTSSDINTIRQTFDSMSDNYIEHITSHKGCSFGPSDI